jgi:hypothetical protein
MQVFTVTKNRDLITHFELADNVRRRLGATQLNFIVPSAMVNEFTAAYASRKFCKIIDEAEILSHSLKEIETWNVFAFPERAGWYFQQFLKIAVAEHSIAEPKYLIWDADTVPYRHLRFFDDQGRLLFTEGPEFHEPYFETNDALIGVDRRRDGVRFSAISQHMPVCRDLMIGLLRRISRVNDSDWLSAVKAAISDGRESRSLFSEYELFADWVRREYPDRYCLRRLSWSRNGNLFTPIQLMAAKRTMFFIAFETWHKRPMFLDQPKGPLWDEILAPLALPDRVKRLIKNLAS